MDTIHGINFKTAKKLDLDLKDIVILSWIEHMQGYVHEKTIDNKKYIHIKYQELIDALPILKITNKRALARRLDYFCEINLLEKFVAKDTSGTKTYFHIKECGFEKLFKGFPFLSILSLGWKHNVNDIDEENK